MNPKKEHKRHPCFVSKDFSPKDLIKEDPPDEALKRQWQAKWKLLTAALQKRKNEWFRLQSYDNHKTASAVVTKLKKAYKGQGFEFVHHKGRLWGRYVGTDSAE